MSKEEGVRLTEAQRTALSEEARIAAMSLRTQARWMRNADVLGDRIVDRGAAMIDRLCAALQTQDPTT